MRAMGLDVGSVTVGVSLSDELKMIANSYTVIRYSEENDELFDSIIEIIKEKDVDVVVIGMPYHMNYDKSIGTERSIHFKEEIQKRIDIKVELVDERLSTVTAQHSLISANMQRKKRKQVVDKIAAAIILQNYLDMKR